MKHAFPTGGLALALALALAGTARAGDEPADAAALLRQGKTAETVDHDVAKAMEIYRRVVDSGGTTDAARDAALRLAELLETKGDRGQALEMLKTITERFTPRLDDEAKRRVHEAMARLLPAGSHARSPLGDVYVLPAPGARAPAGSPLEEKILGILSKLDSAEADKRGYAETEIEEALVPVGTDALPTLEKVMRGDRPDRARFAAKMYAKTGKAGAIPGLERTVREGDGFARSAALDALLWTGNGLEGAPELVVAFDRLLDFPAVASRRDDIRDRVSQLVTPEQGFARHMAGGPDAGFWLQQAVGGKHAPAVARVLELSKAGGPVSDELVEALRQIAGGSVGVSPGRVFRVKPAQPDLDPRVRTDVLELLVRQETSEVALASIGEVAGAIAVTSPGSDAAARATAAAWDSVLKVKDVDVRAQYVLWLLQCGVQPFPGVFDDPARVRSYGELLPRVFGRPELARGSDPGADAALLQTALHGSRGFWAAWLAALPNLDPGRAGVRTAMEVLHQAMGDRLPPPEFDRQWLGVLRRPELGNLDYKQMFLRAAARGDGSAYMALLQELTYGSDMKDQRLLTEMVYALPSYKGTDRAEYVLEAIARAGDRLQSAGFLLGLLQEEMDPTKFWDYVLAAMPKMSSQLLSATVGALSQKLGDTLPPESYDARWIDVLALPNLRDVGATWIVKAAARSGDSRFIDVVRRITLVDNGFFTALGETVMKNLGKYKGPGRLEYLVDALAKPEATWNGSAVYNTVYPLLVAEKDPKALEVLVGTASKPESPSSWLAVRELANARARAALARLFEAQAAAAVPGPPQYRQALIQAAVSLHLREAFPFLLREFKEGLSKEAEKAMEEIRGYHDRMSTYEAWTRGEEGGKKDLAALLKDADPEIRRAAVMSLAALGDREALPALVKFAKEESDPRVRQAALDAVERLAKAPPPSPAAPSPSPAMDR